LKRGDRVVVPFPIACGKCWFCEHAAPTQCENSNPEHYGPEGGLLSQKGGALFGYTDLYGGYDGGQAQFVRVPYADYGPRKVPDWVFLSQLFNEVILKDRVALSASAFSSRVSVLRPSIFVTIVLPSARNQMSTTFITYAGGLVLRECQG